MKHIKITSVLLSVVMCASLVLMPVSAIADETEAPAETSAAETTEAEETTAKETEKPEEKETEATAPESKETEPEETEKQETEEAAEPAPEESEKEPVESEEPSGSEETRGKEKTVKDKTPDQTDSVSKKASISGRLLDLDLGTAVVGYDRLDYNSGLYLANNGTTVLSGTSDNMKIELTSGDKSAFDLRYQSSGNMAPDGVYMKAYIYPKAGLSAKSYSATATVYYDEDGSGSSHGWVVLSTAKITFTVLAAGPKHKVTIVNGTSNKSTASKGEIIKLTPSVPANKAFSKWEVISGTVNFIYTHEFYMPDTDVKIQAVFVDKKISATLNDLDLGIAPVGFKPSDFYGRMTLDNTGTKYLDGSKNALRVELTGGDKSAFDLKHEPCGVIKPEAHVLAAEITPKSGLAKGTYTATVTMYYDEDGDGTYHDWIVLDTATVTITVMTRVTGLKVNPYTVIINTEGAQIVDEEEISGSVRFDKTTVTTGDIVTVYAVPNAGYELNKITWQNGVLSPEIDITSQREFQVRDKEPYVYVYYRKLKPDDPVKYTAHVTIMCPSGIDETGKSGTVTLDKYLAQSGETITVKAIPNSGYVYSQMIWTDGERGASINITSTRSFKVGNNDPYIYVLFWNEPVPNTLFSVKPKTATVKYKKLKKKNQTVDRSKVLTISNSKGDLKYSLVTVKRGKSKKYKKYFKINSTTGTVTVKKKLKKGTYKITCKVTCSGNADYLSATKTVTFTIKVK